jgi:sugar phosphate isomerase/epimerase
MTRPIRILGSYWTLAVGADPDPRGDPRCLHDFRLRVETAAKAGFTAMGFWHADLLENRRRLGFPEMKRILDGNGIDWIEVEWLLDWFCTDARRAASDETRKLLLDAAEEFGAHHIKIGDLGNDCADGPRMTEEFAKLCREAAERGTNVLFEMLPAAFSRAPSLDAVVAICRGSGARNGGIMLDNLHLQRTGRPADLDVHPDAADPRVRGARQAHLRGAPRRDPRHTHLADGAEASIVGSLATLKDGRPGARHLSLPRLSAGAGQRLEGDDGRDLRQAHRHVRRLRRLDAPRRPRRGFLGTSGIVGQGIPHATGAAYAAQIRKQGQVVLGFFGDGASKQGAFRSR